MAVLWDDLTTPEGELDVGLLFPDDGDSGEARLTGYIADGVARTTTLTDTADEAVTLWAQYRAYLAKYQATLGEATTQTKSLVDQGSKTTSLLWSQVAAWKTLADERLAAFNALLAAAVADTSDALGGWSVLRSLRHA